MLPTIKIALRLPGTTNTNGHFSVRLQQQSEEVPCTYRDARRLFAVPGNKDQFKAFCHLLIKHQIIDHYLRWTFGEGHLVIFGNSNDDLAPDTNWWWFLYSLEQKARAKGGGLHFLPGTHELMHLNGSWKHKHPAYPPAAAKLRNPFIALYNANTELQRWLGARNFIEKIGRCLFVHHDLLPLLSEQKKGLKELNAFARSFNIQQPIRFTAPLPVIEIVNALREQFSADTLITGNSLQMQNNILSDGRLIHIMADYTNGNPAGLFIKRRRFIQVDRKGHRQKIKL